LLDSIGNVGRTCSFILSIRRILDCIEGYVYDLKDWLKEVPQKSDIFAISMKIDEAFLGFPTYGVRNFEIRHCSSFLHKRS
jgi:hypothetical protein